MGVAEKACCQWSGLPAQTTKTSPVLCRRHLFRNKKKRHSSQVAASQLITPVSSSCCSGFQEAGWQMGLVLSKDLRVFCAVAWWGTMHRETGRWQNACVCCGVGMLDNLDMNKLVSLDKCHHTIHCTQSNMQDCWLGSPEVKGQLRTLWQVNIVILPNVWTSSCLLSYLEYSGHEFVKASSESTILMHLDAC